MFKLEGKFDKAKVFANNLEEEAILQIKGILDNPISKNAHTRIMADAHAGKGCVIGYTARVTDQIIPNLIGVDIGCGVTGVRLKNKIIDLEKLDSLAHASIPTGKKTYFDGFIGNNLNWDSYVVSFALKNGLGEDFFDSLREICDRTNQDYSRVINSIGTLGGGNHYCEIGVDSEERKWFTVHSGSRNFGYRVADYWQTRAYEKLNEKNKDKDIAYIKENFEGKEIGERIRALTKEKVSKEFSYLKGSDLKDYLRDASVATKYAELNRRMIIERLFGENDYDKLVESTHNYIEADIIRKGAISAYAGQELFIPLNMRDGTIFGIGKGNEDYNFSAPHGAGRKMSRTKAKESITLESFKKSMEGIYSSCIAESTIDESPMAYKNKKEIIDNIEGTVEIKEIIKPIWNFKAK